MSSEDATRATKESAFPRPAMPPPVTPQRPEGSAHRRAAAAQTTPGAPVGGMTLLREGQGNTGRAGGPPADQTTWTVVEGGTATNVDNKSKRESLEQLRRTGASNVDNTSRPEASRNAKPGDPSTSNVDNVSARELPPKPVPPTTTPRPRPLPRPGAQMLPATHRAPSSAPAPDPAHLAELRRTWAEREVAIRKKQDSTILGSAEGTTRTPETIQRYDARGKQLLARFRRELNMDPSAGYDPREWAAWFIARRPSLSSATWRSYKQAVLYILSALEGAEAEEAVRIVEADSAWEGEMSIKPQKRNPDAVKRTSANKAKTIPFSDYEKLDAYLSLRAWSKHAQTLKDWLRAGLATGLRPEEWQQCDVIEHGSQRYLFVLNAKSTNGRANGVSRTLNITDFTDETFYAVQRMAANGKEWFTEDTYDSVQSQCAQILYRANEAIWRRREATAYALYTCRHQFILNMRASNVPEEELSAMLGHLVTETQMEHYGKRGKGWSPDKILDIPKGVNDEVATVRRTLTLANRRAELEALIGTRRKRAAVQDDPDPGMDIDNDL